MKRALLAALLLSLVPLEPALASSSTWILDTGAKSNEFDLTKNEFSTETRFGFVMKQGNSQKETLSGGSYTLYRVRRWENKWKIYTLLDRVFDTSNHFDLYLYGIYRVDYFITDRLTYYIGSGLYIDEVKGIDKSLHAFNGVSYFLMRKPNTYLRGSVGYRFTWEDPVPPNPNDTIHAAAFEVEFSYKFNDHFSVFQNAGFFESVTEGNDFRILSDTELKAGLTKHFGIVLAYRIRFDNKAVPSFEKLDTIADASLAVTF